MGKGDSERTQGGTVMSEDALVNTGAVVWPEMDWAQVTVRRMQAKLHCWAAGDPGRRFDDLYNLVCDPAFLVVATRRGQCRGTDGWDRSGHGGLHRLPVRGRGVLAACP